MFGMIIQKISLIGPEKDTSELLFLNKLNIIYGPSDTGKSLAAECIDYALGGSDKIELPKIALGYKYVVLKIKTVKEDTCFSVARSLDDEKEDIFIFNGEESKYNFETAIRASLNEKKNQILFSDFILEKIGCKYKNIYKNSQGETKRFSYRSFARISILDENRISEKSSIVFASASKNADFKNLDAENAFNIILSGIVLERQPKIDIKSQKTLKEGMILGLEEALLKLQKENGVLVKKKQGSDIESLFNIKEKLILSIKEKEGEIQRLNIEVLELKKKLNIENANIIEIQNNIDKFRLLKENYESDRLRLEFISQAKELDDQMIECECPICGSIVPKTNIDESFSEKVIFEIKRINGLIDNIEESILQLAYQKEIVEKNIEQIFDNIKKIEKDVAIGLTSETARLVSNLDEVTAKIYVFQKYISNERSIKVYTQRIQELKNEIKNTKKVKIDTNLITKDMHNDLCKCVKPLLVACQLMTEKDTLYFNREDFDFVINGQSKKAFGKGTRAILNSLFAIGISLYCKDHNLCHPYTIMLDSPLATYYDKKNNEGKIIESMDQLFYSTLEKVSRDFQIIIFENREPKNIKGNLVEFTKNEEGRSGFIVERKSEN